MKKYHVLSMLVLLFSSTIHARIERPVGPPPHRPIIHHLPNNEQNKHLPKNIQNHNVHNTHGYMNPFQIRRMNTPQAKTLKTVPLSSYTGKNYSCKNSQIFDPHTGRMVIKKNCRGF